MLLFCFWFHNFAEDLKVTLAIFSGRPDPEWQVLTSDPNYKEIERLLDIARSAGFIYRHENMPARLGYKGFLVQNTAKKNAESELIIGLHTAHLQQLLLKTIPDGIMSEKLLSDISKEIGTGAVTSEAQEATTSSDLTSSTASPSATPGNANLFINTCSPLCNIFVLNCINWQAQQFVSGVKQGEINLHLQNIHPLASISLIQNSVPSQLACI